MYHAFVSDNSASAEVFDFVQRRAKNTPCVTPRRFQAAFNEGNAMSIYKRGKVFAIYVPTRNGGRAVKTTGTMHKPTAQKMAAMLLNLGQKGQRRWDLLDPLVDGRLTVPQLYDAYAHNVTEQLLAELADIDLQDFVSGWYDSVKLRIQKGSDTHQQYLTKVRTLLTGEVPFPRSRLTHVGLTQWLSNVSVSNSTKRKYHAAMSSFCGYLIGAGVLAENPMRLVKAPAANRPRMRYLDMEEVRRLVEANDGDYRALSALLHGTGIEISVALALKASDVDRHRLEVRARGTKTASRDRIAAIAGWAWKYLEPHTANLLPNALLFPNTDRWRSLDAHKEACKRVGIENYRQHDARHTYAVIAIRAGAPFEFVARQLGHADTTQVVKVYGRFRLSEHERRDWEAVAAAQEHRRKVG
jgi:integrase